MRFALEFHDSELRDVVREGTLVRLRLAASAVRNEAGERGWLASVTLEMTAATLQGDITHAFGKITRAGLRQDTRSLRSLDVPGRLTGDVELALHLANGTQFVVRGHTLASSVADDARFTEDLSC